ncbi:MAG: queuosine precursor transporter, partial [Candidatus Pacebacteria bacterium]|nr:queuosine precursor transporter [Candidatus Paceibacterota bacterium]
MNEILFITFAFFCLSLVLVAFRMGKLYLFLLISVFTILMNIFVLKQFELFGLLITGGNILYGSLFLITDLLSEHYGKKEAFRAVIIGFLTSAFFVVALQFLLAFVPSVDDFAQDSLNTLFSIAPRILIGSMLAYLIAQSVDIILYDKIKSIKSSKNYLWLRNNGSTLISQAIDTFIFTLVGLTTLSFLPFGGVIPVEIFWEVF